MAVQAHPPTGTPARSIGIQRQAHGITLAAIGGLILLGYALYMGMLMQTVAARMEALPQVRSLLVTTNDRLATMSSQLDGVDANMRKLPPLLSQVNENVRQLSPPLQRVNGNVQGTAPTLRRMDGRLTVTNQRLTTVQQKLDTLRQSIDRMEETTHRLRKVLPR
jgi:chromosome segregation ATPase